MCVGGHITYINISKHTCTTSWGIHFIDPVGFATAMEMICSPGIIARPSVLATDIFESLLDSNSAETGYKFVNDIHL